eukprot:7527998-Ditylum_brightwellii.AAC.1
MSHGLKDEEIADYKEAFGMFDIDGDGALYRFVWTHEINTASSVDSPFSLITGLSWSLMHNERAYCVKAELGQNFLDPLHC